MYLKRAIVENSGPLRWLDLDLQFLESGPPKPLTLVGGNGGGKTNLLSLVADALFEAAAIHYENVLPQRGAGRAWFRVVGGRNLTVGTEGGFCLLEFDDAGTSRFFKEKAGKLDAEAIKSRVNGSIGGQIAWPTEGSIKEFSLDDDTSKRLFEEGSYAYFPSSRSEIPHWLNREAFPETEFESSPKFSKRLSKPIYVEKSLDKFKQWILGIITDARCDIGLKIQDGAAQYHLRGNPTDSLVSSTVLEINNNILRTVMGDPEVRFVWLGRKSPDKIAVAKGQDVTLPNLDALSSGQSILLGMFGTILKYGDFSQNGSGVDISNIEGICIIDEIDAHIHVELQSKALPELIKMFPRIQFILSSHSPIFVLGMERVFGAGGIQVIEMPNGTPVGSETYAEFGKALEALSATGAFTERVIAQARAAAKPIVYVEGETDAPYLRRAAELLGKQALLEKCDIEWIGAKDENGQGFLTGKDAMKQVFSVLRANPNLARQKILLLNDNDTNSLDQDLDFIKVRKIPINPKNEKIIAGIENLLSEDCLELQWYQTIERKKPNGDSVSTTTLRKSDLCDFLCKNGTAEQFAGFSGAIAIIEDFITA
jgi:AAA domain, putative AbiEii toxin, Type IV TA system